MFGNLKGWIIAAVVLLVEVALVIWLLRLDDLSGPTAFGADPQNMQPIALPFDPRPLVPATVQQDAGPLYRQAVRTMSDNRLIYERFAQRADAAALPQLEAFKFAIEARNMAKATIFEDRLDQIIRYNQPDRTELVALEQLGKGLLNAGTLNMTSNPEQARKYFEAAFNLGYHLFNERIVFQQLSIGINLMSIAADGLSGLPGADSAKFEQYRSTRGEYFTNRVMPVWGVLSTIDNRKIGKHVGDMFAFARNSKERMFRVEAILAMGRLRFNIGTGGRAGDQQGAERLLREIAENPSSAPADKAAARLALELTVEQFRTIQ